MYAHATFDKFTPPLSQTVTNLGLRPLNTLTAALFITMARRP